MPPAGVQKVNVCFTCCSLCGSELDTILSNTVPLVWAESPWIAGKCRTSVGGFVRNQASITPVVSCAERAYLCQPKPEDGTKQAAEAQPRHRARVWRHRALPDRRRSRARRAARLEGRLAAAHPDGWRYLQHAETPGTSFLWRKRSGWEATAIRWCVCARPARASLRLPHAR